jgi:hypothetical protein
LFLPSERWVTYPPSGWELEPGTGARTQTHKEQEDQGWSYSDLSVCTRCVGETVLQAAVEADETGESSCTFYASSPAASLDCFLGPFGRGVRREFEDANENTFWDGAEGGFQAPTLETWEVLDWYSHVFLADGFSEAVANAMGDTTWVSKTWAWRSTDKMLTDSWNKFCEAIKHETRYVFWRKPTTEHSHEPDELPPAQILDAVGEFLLIYPEVLIRELDTEGPLWRARPHGTTSFEPTPGELGTTPIDKSRTNRMSPSGIPMFYGALDRDTAAHEAAQGSTCTELTCARFQPSRPIMVLDLTSLKPIPSVFADDGNERPQWLFLHSFTESLRAKPTSPDVDYVPTQVVTEYFLKVYDREHFDGILYKSDVEQGEVCVVLDVDNEGCVAMAEGWNNHDQLKLGLLADSVVRVHRRTDWIENS